MTDQSMIATAPLTVRSNFANTGKPFDGDLLGRMATAELMSSYISRLKVGAVISIDAPWGEGKTWFGRNWEMLLKDAGHQTIYIDAFQQDYVSDPFLLIASEISLLLEKNSTNKQEFIERAATVGKVILPIATKLIVDALGRMASGVSGISDKISTEIEAASSATAEATEKWVAERLQKYADEKQSVTSFREMLVSFAENQERPTVIFVDELDRCEPIFAVKLIERIKHFFDVPNVVFVLLVNRHQLESSVKGVYGSETDATTYISKFIHLAFSLPNAKHGGEIGINRIQLFINRTLSNFGLAGGNQSINGFVDGLAHLAIDYDLSLRDVEKCCSLFILTQCRFGPLMAHLIPLKLKRPSLFIQSRSKDRGAYKRIAILIDEFLNKQTELDETWHKSYLRVLLEFNRALADGADLNLLEEDKSAYRFIFGNHGGWRSAVDSAYRVLDLPLDF